MLTHNLFSSIYLSIIQPNTPVIQITIASKKSMIWKDRNRKKIELKI